MEFVERLFILALVIPITSFVSFALYALVDSYSLILAILPILLIPILVVAIELIPTNYREKWSKEARLNKRFSPLLNYCSGDKRIRDIQSKVRYLISIKDTESLNIIEAEFFNATESIKRYNNLRKTATAEILAPLKEDINASILKAQSKIDNRAKEEVSDEIEVLNKTDDRAYTNF